MEDLTGISVDRISSSYESSRSNIDLYFLLKLNVLNSGGLI